jgi:hypothetical protein
MLPLPPSLMNAKPVLPASSPRLFALEPLTHPLWWVALSVLLVNDNLLKGRGLVPAWLTGKLSDFAFLIVAPVLLSALLPVRLRGRRLVALVSVVSLYVAADLSSGFRCGGVGGCPIRDALAALA